MDCTFVCTYNLHDPEDQEEMYRIQLLDALQMDNWDEKIMKKKTNELYNVCMKEQDFIPFFDTYKNECLNTNIFSYLDETPDDEIIFLSMLNFDYFHKLHKFFCKINNK